MGYLTKAHGIRGELTCVFTAEAPELKQSLLGKRLYLRPRAGGETHSYVVSGLRTHHGALLIALSGVSTRTEAELLRSHTVLMPQSELPPLEDDEVYIRDLPGLRVLVASQEDPDAPEWELGRIVSVDAPAGQLLWTIHTDDGREVLFPAVDDFVVSIEPDKGVARIAPPPGLLDIYLSE